MNRRSFIKAAAALAAAVGLRKAAPAKDSEPPTLSWGGPGFYDAFAFWRAGFSKVYLDGRDVTSECDAVNVREGWASLLRVSERHADGRAKCLCRPVAKYLAFGRVELERRPSDPLRPATFGSIPGSPPCEETGAALARTNNLIGQMLEQIEGVGKSI